MVHAGQGNIAALDLKKSLAIAQTSLYAFFLQGAGKGSAVPQKFTIVIGGVAHRHIGNKRTAAVKGCCVQHPGSNSRMDIRFTGNYKATVYQISNHKASADSKFAGQIRPAIQRNGIQFVQLCDALDCKFHHRDFLQRIIFHVRTVHLAADIFHALPDRGVRAAVLQGTQAFCRHGQFNFLYTAYLVRVATAQFCYDRGNLLSPDRGDFNTKFFQQLAFVHFYRQELPRAQTNLAHTHPTHRFYHCHRARKAVQPFGQDLGVQVAVFQIGKGDTVTHQCLGSCKQPTLNIQRTEV